MEACADETAPPWRARLPPGSYADTAGELDTDEDYEEEEDEECWEPRDQRAHMPGASHTKGGRKEVCPLSLPQGAHSEPGSSRARLRAPGRVASKDVMDNHVLLPDEEAGFASELKKRGGGDRAGTSRFKGVSWFKTRGRWRATCKGKHLGFYITEVAAARAYSKYLKDGIHPLTVGSSQFKGVSWNKRDKSWKTTCNERHLGYHATEEHAARAYSKYLEDGIDPVKHREANTSQFTGVTWDKHNNKWKARCKGTFLGLYTTEEAAAHAHNVKAESLDVALNVIPPTGTSAGAGPGASSNVGHKRVLSKTPAAPATNTKEKRAAPTTSSALAPSKKM